MLRLLSVLEDLCALPRYRNRRIDRDPVTPSNQMAKVGVTIGSHRRDIQRVNAVPLASERSSNLAVTLALRNRHPPSVAERSCGFRWVPV